MLDCLKDIIVSLIDNKQIANNADVDKNIEDVQKAIKEIGKELHKVSCSKFDE